MENRSKAQLSHRRICLPAWLHLKQSLSTFTVLLLRNRKTRLLSTPRREENWLCSIIPSVQVNVRTHAGFPFWGFPCRREIWLRADTSGSNECRLIFSTCS